MRNSLRDYLSLALMALCFLVLPALANAQMYMPYAPMPIYYIPTYNVTPTYFSMPSYQSQYQYQAQPNYSGYQYYPQQHYYPPQSYRPTSSYQPNYYQYDQPSSYTGFSANRYYGPGDNPAPFGYGTPTGDSDALGNQLCNWPGYGRSPCDFDPHQWVYDPYTGTWY